LLQRAQPAQGAIPKAGRHHRVTVPVVPLTKRAVHNVGRRAEGGAHEHQLMCDCAGVKGRVVVCTCDEAHVSQRRNCPCEETIRQQGRSHPTVVAWHGKYEHVAATGIHVGVGK